MLRRLVCSGNMQAENSGKTATLYLSEGFNKRGYYHLIWHSALRLTNQRLITVGATEQRPINFFNGNGMPHLAVRTFVFNRQNIVKGNQGSLFDCHWTFFRGLPPACFLREAAIMR